MSVGVTRPCVLPIPGTHGDDGEPTGLWWHDGSPLMRYFAEDGLGHLNAERPFTWSTDLNGHRFWRRWFGARDDHRDWIAGGYALSYYAWPVRDLDQYLSINERNFIAHSHAGQVVFYACALGGLRVNRLVTVGTPIRRDMQAIIARARPMIGQWLHIRGDHDNVAIWGGLGDGRISRSRDFKDDGPDWTDVVPGIGHSRVLTDPTQFHHWRQRAWLDFLKNGW